MNLVKSLIAVSFISTAVSKQQQLLKDFSVSWSSDQETVTFQLCGNFSGWMAIGFTTTDSGMSSADIYSAEYDESNKWTVNDRFSDGYSSPDLDTNQGGSNGVTNIYNAAGACYSTQGVGFTRKIKTSDSTDVSLDAPVYVIAAHVDVRNQVDDLSDYLISYHGRSKIKVGLVDFRAPLAVAVSKTSVVQPSTVANIANQMKSRNPAIVYKVSSWPVIQNPLTAPAPEPMATQTPVAKYIVSTEPKASDNSIQKQSDDPRTPSKAAIQNPYNKPTATRKSTIQKQSNKPATATTRTTAAIQKPYNKPTTTRKSTTKKPSFKSTTPRKSTTIQKPYNKPTTTRKSTTKKPSFKSTTSRKSTTFQKPYNKPKTTRKSTPSQKATNKPTTHKLTNRGKAATSKLSSTVTRLYA